MDKESINEDAFERKKRFADVEFLKMYATT